MSTFDAVESSTDLGTPLELYLFQSASATYAYCNGEDDYTFDGITYFAAPIDRDRITASGTLDRAALTVSIADTTPLAAVLRGYPVSSVIVLTIRQGHHEMSSDFLVAWVGRVLSAKGGNDGIRQITCQPAATGLKRTGLRRFWQYGCPHVLYGSACRADRLSRTVQAVSSGSNGSTAFAPSGWHGAFTEANFIGGLAQWTNTDGSVEVRTIMRAADQYLVLGGPASYVVGTTVSLSVGCDHTMVDCQGLHKPSDEADYGGGNIRNFGGQPFIPTTNPVGIARNY